MYQETQVQAGLIEQTQTHEVCQIIDTKLDCLWFLHMAIIIYDGSAATNFTPILLKQDIIKTIFLYRTYEYLSFTQIIFYRKLM